MRKKAKPPNRFYPDRDETRNKFLRKKRIKKIILVTILILFILIFVSGQRGSYQLYKFTKQADELEKEIARISAEIMKLE
jgi:cell division protein FtsB